MRKLLFLSTAILINGSPAVGQYVPSPPNAWRNDSRLQVARAAIL